MINIYEILEDAMDYLPENCERCKHKVGCTLDGLYCPLLRVYDMLGEVQDRLAAGEKCRNGKDTTI